MKSMIRLCCVGLWLLLAAAPCLAEDQIPWVADFQTACGMAAEQHRLVLLHFYSDNCDWCVRLEQNVFSQTEVGQAVAENYVALKVHAGKTPELATKYHVRAFPTDVIVHPSGLEIYRTVSRQKPAEYIAVLNQVAEQTGVSAGRQWKSPLAQAAPPAAAGAAAAANNLVGNLNGAAQQGATEGQNALNQLQQRWGTPVSQFQQAADQARAASQQVQQQAGDAFQQGRTGATQWSQQASEAVQRYEQQGGDAYRQFRDQAGQFRAQSGQTAEQMVQQAQAARQNWLNAAQQAGQPLGETARDVRNQWQPPGSQPGVDRRSAFVPLDASPASPQPAAPGAQSVPPQISNQPAVVAAQPPTPAPQSSYQSLVPTENPWVTARSNQPAAPPATQPPAPTHASPNTTPSLAANNQQLVPAAQAPPIALDGFCPVTLLETVSRDPKDRSAWKKGDRNFGAIHLGRTYLFASAENQQKFLANPDAYAPALAGCDPVRYAERGEYIEGKRAYGLVTSDLHIYLFADEASLNRYKQSPGTYSAAVEQATRTSGGGTIYR